MRVTVYLDELAALNTALNYLLLAGSARLGGGTLRRCRLHGFPHLLPGRGAGAPPLQSC